MDNEKTRVLLIDDDATLLRSLKRQLCEFGFDVETSSCAAEARVMLNVNPFNAVVCDHNMPGQSGLEFLEDIRQIHPNVAIFMLSGQVSGVSIAEAWAEEIGVIEIFNKPCDANLIAQRIETSIAKQDGLSDLVP